MTKLLTITPGQVKVGEVTVEINGGALDALSLAEQFVQVFDVRQEAQLREEAHASGAFRPAERVAVLIALDLWAEAERRYKIEFRHGALKAAR